MLQYISEHRYFVWSVHLYNREDSTLNRYLFTKLDEKIDTVGGDYYTMDVDCAEENCTGRGNVLMERSDSPKAYCAEKQVDTGRSITTSRTSALCM